MEHHSHLSTCKSGLHVDNFLIPCPFKYLTGIDCPGCGFQRSVLLMLKGDYSGSFQMYPPALFIILTVLTVLFSRYLLKYKSERMIKTLYILSGSAIFINYIYKIFVYF